MIREWTGLLGTRLRRASVLAALRMSIPAFAGMTILSVFLTGCRKPEIGGRTPPTKALDAPRLDEFELARYETNELAFILEARRADLLEGQGEAKIFQPVLKIYKKGSGGKLIVRANSRRGSVRFDSKDVVLEEGVVYDVLPRDVRLTTSKLIYWAGRRETEVPDGTGYTLVTPQGTLEGSGMLSKEDLTQ